MKKLISFLLVFILLAEVLPVGTMAAGNVYVLSDTKVSRIMQRAGLNSSNYHPGMKFSSGMSGYQMLCWVQDFIDQEISVLVNLYNDLADELESDSQYSERVSLLREVSDFISNEMNRYEFDMNNDLNVINSSSLILSRSDYTDAEKSVASRDMEAADERLAKMMNDLTELQSVVEKSLQETREELQTIHDKLSKPKTLDLREDQGGVVRSAAGKNEGEDGDTPRDGNTTGFSFLILKTGQIGIQLMDKDTQAPIPNATVRLSDQNHTVTKKTGKEGTAVFDSGSFAMDAENSMRASMQISADGYRQVDGYGFRVLAGSVWNISLQKDDGRAYLQSMNFRGTDILHETEEIYASPYNDATQKLTARVHVGVDGKFTLSMEYDDAITKKREKVTQTYTGTPGKVKEVELSGLWCQKMQPGTDVRFTLSSYAPDGDRTKEETYDALVSVREGVVDRPVYEMKAMSALNFSTISLSIPVSLPNMDYLDIGLSLPPYTSKEGSTLAPTIVLTQQGDFTLGIAYTKALKKVDETKQKWKTADKAYLADQRSRWMDGITSLKKLAEENMLTGGNPYKPMDYFDKKPVFEVTAYISGSITENPWETKDSNDRYDGNMSIFASAGVKMTYSFERPFVIGPVPVFVGFDFTIGVSVGIDFNFTFKSSRSRAIEFDGWHDVEFDKSGMDIILTPSLKIAAYAGVGVRKILALYIRGTASLTLAFHIRPMNKINTFRLITTLKLSLEGCVEVLFVPYSKTIVEKTWQWDTDKSKVGASGQESEGVNVIKKASEQVQYPTFDVRELQLNANSENGLKTCVTDVKNDSRIFFASLDWFNDALKRLKGKEFEEEDIEYDPELYLTKKGLRYYDPDSGKFGELDVGMNIGAFALPYTVRDYGSGVKITLIPSDAYTVSFDMVGASDTFDIRILVWYARRSEDKSDKTPGRLYPQMIILKGGSDDYGRPCVQSDSFRVRKVGSSGPSFEKFTMPDFTSVERDCLCWTDGKVLMSGNVSYNTDSGIVYGANHTLEIRSDRELRQVITSQYPSYGYEVALLYGQSESDPNDLLDYYYYNEPVDEDGQKSYCYIYHKEFSEQISSVTHIDTTSAQAAKHGPSVYILNKKDDQDDGLVTCELQTMYPTDGIRNITDSQILGKRIDLGVRVSNARFSVVSVGNINSMYYLTKESENGRTQTAVNAIYMSMEDNGEIFISHPFHLGVFDEKDMPQQSGIKELNFMPMATGFLNGMFLADNSDAGSGKYDYIARYFSLKQTMQIDLRGCAVDRCLVEPGDVINMAFKVMNTGNVPVSGFDLSVKASDDSGRSWTLSDIHVDCVNPDENSVINYILGDTDSTFTGPSAVSEYDDALDGDNNYWTVTERGGAPSVYSTTVLMPEETHNYRAAFKVPKDFNGESYHVWLTLKEMRTKAVMDTNGVLYAGGAWAGSLEYIGGESGTNRPKAAATEETVYTVVATVPDTGDRKLAASEGDTVPVTLSVLGPDGIEAVQGTAGKKNAGTQNNPLAAFAAKTVPTRRDVDLAGADLILVAQYALNETEKIAHIVIRNNTATPMSGLQVTAAVNGKETWRYAFDPKFELDYTNTCSLDIPVEKLTGGAIGEYLELTVSGAEEDIIPENNTDKLLLSAIFRIITDPEDQTVPEGSTAKFTVAAAGGTRPYTYQWQVVDSRNGTWKNLKGENDRVLKLTDVRKKQNGTLYRCIVTDAEGQQLTSGSAMLLVKNLPVTGDTAVPAAWLIALSVSALLIAVLMRRRKKTA